jgi:hypothetical protein
MRIPRKVALFGATVLMLALIPASSAFAYNASEKASEKRQNARTSKLAKDLTAAKKSMVDLGTKIDGVDGRLKAIEGAAPQIVKGLGDLRDASLALKAGLEGLKSLATSTEYGVGQVFIGGNPEGGAFIVTPDIPDAVQQAQSTAQFIAQQSGAITVRVGIRSAESDGTGGDNPAAACRVTIVQEGAAPNARTSLPNPDLGGAPFWQIQNKSPQTSTDPAQAGFPFGLIATDQTTDLTSGANSTAPAGSPSATAGTPFTVTLSCVDTSPSAADPTA